MNWIGMIGKLAVLGAVSVVLLAPKLLTSSVLLSHALRLAVLFWLLIEVGRHFVVGVVRNDHINGSLKNIFTSMFILFAVLMLLEMVFMFIPQSHGVGYPYAAKNWFSYYWRTNERGYRDKPINEVDLTKPRILIVGDSFTAGYGVRDARDTFAGQLSEIADDRFEVINLGKIGANTRGEFISLREYPNKPDILLLQYYGNDIGEAANDAGIYFDGYEKYSDLSPVVAYLVQGSSLLNYAYWQFPHGDVAPYIEFLIESYNDPAAMGMHSTELGMFVKYAKDCNIPLLVIVFPLLRDIKKSLLITQPVIKYFNDQGVPAIDIGELVRDMPVSERVVNHHDGHPSVAVHRRVAETIWKKLTDLGWLDRPIIKHPEQCGDPANTAFH